MLPAVGHGELGASRVRRHRLREALAPLSEQGVRAELHGIEAQGRERVRRDHADPFGDAEPLRIGIDDEGGDAFRARRFAGAGEQHMGVGDAVSNAKALDTAVEELATITGQKPVVTKAKKSIAGFRLREGMAIGCKVTLRGERMYEFLDKLISVSLPRVRDFRGISKKAFDGRGNYTLGVKEQLIFPEIDYDKVNKVRGMDIVIVTTANTDEEARELLGQFGMPFQK